MRHLLALILALIFVGAEARTLKEALQENNRAFVADTAKTNANSVALATMASFAKVKAVYGIEIPFYVSVIERGGATLPEAMIVDISLEIMSEAQRCFILAHEFGHLKRKHFEQRLDLLDRLVPGNVDDDAVKPTYTWVLLHPEVREQSWAMEFVADGDAALVLQQLGFSGQQILLAVQGFSVRPSSPTHPSSTQRFMNLRRILNQ